MTFPGHSIINDYPQKLCVSSNRDRLTRVIAVSDIDVNIITIRGSQDYTMSFLKFSDDELVLNHLFIYMYILFIAIFKPSGLRLDTLIQYHPCRG